MRGRKTGQDKRIVKEPDDLSVEGVIHREHMAMKKRGEIAVFDAGKYFAGADNQRLAIVEMEEELDEDADAEAGGDLPLSPLPEFYSTSNAKRYTRKDDQWKQGNKYAGKTTGGAIASPAQRRTTVTSIDPLHMPNGDGLPSPPSIASAGRNRVCNNEPRAPPSANINNSTHDRLSQNKSSSTKPQPFSPSSRLASFLAKFKLSSESKSKPSSQYSSATPPTSAAAVTQAPKSFYPNAAALPANGKSPSPRGRFLRALSSSSSHSNSLLKPIAHMHHHSSVAASTPVSPAGSDPYSPITHSASTTPTSRKNPRSRPRSHVSSHEATSPGSRLSLPTTDWRRDVDNPSSRSLSTHLPFLRRKLKAYLMPEKSPRHHHEIHQQGMNKQDKMNDHNGARAEDRQHQAHKASATASHLPGVDDKQHHTHKVSAVSKDKPRAAGSAAHKPAPQLDRKPHRGNTMRSPGRQMMRSPGRQTMRSPGLQTTEQPTTKDTRRRGDWRRHAEEMEDDIEVAERLLRVVKEHQSSQTYTSNYKVTSNYRQQSNPGYANHQANGHGGGENNGSSSRKSRKSLMSPSSSPAAANYHSKQPSKEEFACPYDSDSSSDLFEIETLQAFSHVAGLYRPRDLPVYDSNPLKSPLHLK